MKRFFIISFDISSDKKRRRVVKHLKNNAYRVQKSVFEALLNDKQFIDLKKNLDKIIDKSTDSIRYYQLCQMCKQNTQITGQGCFHEDEDLIVV